MRVESKDPEGSRGWCPGTHGGTGHNAPLIFSFPEQPLLFMEFGHQPQFCILTSLINIDYNLPHLSVSFLTFSYSTQAQPDVRNLGQLEPRILLSTYERDRASRAGK